MLIMVPEEQIEFERDFASELNTFVFQYLNKKISYRDAPSLISLLDDSIIVKRSVDEKRSVDDIVSRTYYFLSFFKPKTEEEKKEEELLMGKNRGDDKND